MEDKFKEIIKYAKEQPELIVIEQRKNLIAKAQKPMVNKSGGV